MEIDVSFTPTQPREHGAEIAFRSDLDVRHSIDLRGSGTGGTLTTNPPLSPAPELCFDSLLGACTALQDFVITNNGSGAVTISEVRLEPLALTDWEVVSPALATLPITLLATENLVIRLRWCNTSPAAPGAVGQMIIETTAPDTPTIIVELRREDTSC